MNATPLGESGQSPKLLAAFYHGLDYLDDRTFDVRRVRVPGNAIYRELWRGNLRPVEPPL